jgi:Mor family transcriptional regulator
MQTLTFDQILENIDRLSVEDQEVLIDLVKRRLIEQRRAEIARNIVEAKAEYQAGQTFRGSFDEVMAELNQ